MHNKNATDNGVFEEGQGATGAWEMRKISLKLELKGAASSKGAGKRGEGAGADDVESATLACHSQATTRLFLPKYFPFFALCTKCRLSAAASVDCDCDCDVDIGISVCAPFLLSLERK